MNVLEFSHKYIICGNFWLIFDNLYPWKIIFWKWILHFPNICSLCYIIIDLYKIDLSKCLIYPNNFEWNSQFQITVIYYKGLKEKKLVHQVVSHCSSNKASLNRQLVLSGLFLVSAGAIYCRTKVRRNFKLLCTYLSKSPDKKSCWNGGDGMLFVEKIEGRNSIVLSYDRTTSVRPKPISVSGTETKVQFRYRYWSRFFFSNFSAWWI